jgi:hypothetical protein
MYGIDAYSAYIISKQRMNERISDAQNINLAKRVELQPLGLSKLSRLIPKLVYGPCCA